MNIQQLADRFATLERPAGNVLSGPDVVAQAIAATSQYAGYALLTCREELVAPYPAIDGDTEISESEWAIIRPLFMLYVERENALQLEFSRGMGVDVPGRSSSEISGEITQYETELPRRAFYQPIVTV